jgi:hypothetical protein
MARQHEERSIHAGYGIIPMSEAGVLYPSFDQRLPVGPGGRHDAHRHTCARRVVIGV